MIKILGAIASTLLAMLPLRSDAESLESLRTRDGREYFKVEIIGQDDVGLKIRHEGGTARIPFEKLRDDMQSRYHFETSKAASQKAKEANEQAEHERAQQQAIVKAPEEDAAKPAIVDQESPVNEPADPTPQDDIEGLKNRMRDWIDRIAALETLRATEYSKFRTVNSSYDARGNPRSTIVPDKSGYAKAKKYGLEIESLKKKVNLAAAMIAAAKAKPGFRE